MGGRILAALVGLALGATVGGTAMAAAAETGDAAGRACGLPAQLIAINGPLPHAAAALHHHHLSIVAFGSSSTYGTGASGPAATYPSRLAAALTRLFPGVHPVVANRGVPGDTAAAMMARLQRDVIARAPDLVIWQTGTNDALQDVPVESFVKQTFDGIHRLQAAGIDVVLMEPQYSPKLVARPHYADYVEALRTIGHLTGVPVIRRFDMMRAWVANGRFQNATMLQTDALHMRDASYACLGQAVADGLADAMRDGATPSERLTARATAAK